MKMTRIGTGLVKVGIALVSLVGLGMEFYLAYSLVRGTTTGFYPYNFLDPQVQHGYGGVALYSGAMVLGFAVVGIVALLIGNTLQRLAFYEKLHGSWVN